MCLVQNKGKLAQVFIDNQMGHGLDDDGANYASNFGTKAKTKLETSLYMVQRSACFFQSLTTKSTITGTSLFIECEDYRHSCNHSDDDNNCTDVNSCQY